MVLGAIGHELLDRASACFSRWGDAALCFLILYSLAWRQQCHAHQLSRYCLNDEVWISHYDVRPLSRLPFEMLRFEPIRKQISAWLTRCQTWG
jgi:hypothetical protein